MIALFFGCLMLFFSGVSAGRKQWFGAIAYGVIALMNLFIVAAFLPK